MDIQIHEIRKMKDETGRNLREDSWWISLKIHHEDNGVKGRAVFFKVEWMGGFDHMSREDLIETRGTVSEEYLTLEHRDARILGLTLDKIKAFLEELEDWPVAASEIDLEEFIPEGIRAYQKMTQETS